MRALKWLEGRSSPRKEGLPKTIFGLPVPSMPKVTYKIQKIKEWNWILINLFPCGSLVMNLTTYLNISDSSSSSNRGIKGDRCHWSRRLVCERIFVRISKGVVSGEVLSTWIVQRRFCHPCPWGWGYPRKLAMDAQAFANQRASSPWDPSMINHFSHVIVVPSIFIVINFSF